MKLFIVQYELDLKTVFTVKTVYFGPKIQLDRGDQNS